MPTGHGLTATSSSLQTTHDCSPNATPMPACLLQWFTPVRIHNIRTPRATSSEVINNATLTIILHPQPAQSPDHSKRRQDHKRRPHNCPTNDSSEHLRNRRPCRPNDTNDRNMGKTKLSPLSIQPNLWPIKTSTRPSSLSNRSTTILPITTPTQPPSPLSTRSPDQSKHRYLRHHCRDGPPRLRKKPARHSLRPVLAPGEQHTSTLDTPPASQ